MTMPYRLHLLGSLLLVGAITLAACGGDDAPPAEQGSETPEQSEQAVEEEPTGETEPVEEDEPGEVVEEEQAEPAFDPNREILVYGETFPASIEEVGGVRQFRFEGAEGGPGANPGRRQGRDGPDRDAAGAEPDGDPEQR